MGWMNQIGNILKQYSSAGTAAQTAPDVDAHFDEVAEAVPSGILADGIAAAMRSDQTPALGQLVSSMFSQSNGEQKAGLLNQLLGSLNPAAVAQILSGAGLSGLTGMLSGKTQVTPEQSQQIPPEVVQQMATHAEKNSPSIVDSLSNFYAQHTTLVKTLGGAALSIALAKIAQRTQG